jgi:hypothetical protein
MINQWWRRDFGREPSLEDLTDAQRVVVLAQVLPLRRRWDFGVNVFLALWIVGAAAAMVAAQSFDSWHERGVFVALMFYILLPAYAVGWRRAAVARATHRATIRVIRDDRLETIQSIIDKS